MTEFSELRGKTIVRTDESGETKLTVLNAFLVDNSVTMVFLVKDELNYISAFNTIQKDSPTITLLTKGEKAHTTIKRERKKVW